MSDTDDTNRAIQALKERDTQLRDEIRDLDAKRHILFERLAEIAIAIDLVLRNGRKKPGPKGRQPAEAMVATTADAMMPTYTEDAP